ncbi:peptidoglycan editing factor PgeF [Paraneptunicella aestuarii]|uniref:peptidoglycan editing factor PgeF n=1 Tax=Paraneptunicella aestuarii TaxID=2831148 RepID=UPI001E40BA9A|nr:peptidoglycan editing factor PgeF [Paraneptunicella aestuarii]UAA39959.1 peptidoglycan editing factor PgeF [Paraneptunicella aestuarii]
MADSSLELSFDLASDLAPEWILPDWDAPANIQAFCSTRHSAGESLPPYDSFNIAMHVGDEPEHVESNRQRLPMPDIQWLEQVHSTRALQLPYTGDDLKADACFTFQPEIACAVMTADCLPILLCGGDSQGQAKWIAAIHAGWRGLANGIIEQTISDIRSASAEPIQLTNVQAWLGPAISVNAFEVGEDVKAAFLEFDDDFYWASSTGKFFADLYSIARKKLNALGIVSVSGGDLCTYSDPERFYSYRRDGKTGRMVSLIWIK